MSKTLFERNFESATEKLHRLNMKPITADKMSDLFFFGIKTMPPVVKTYTPVQGRKNAIVLLGSSCIGKSTYAQEFIKHHPEFGYLSMDECAEREMLQAKEIICFSPNIFDNSLGFREFGERLEKGQNLIIDGCWLHLNSRSALLKTLRRLDYNICAFSFLTCPNNVHNERIKSRVLKDTARELLGKPISDRSKNWLEEYQKLHGYSLEKTIALLENTDLFRQNYLLEVANIREEFESAGAYSQITSGLIFIAFDRIHLVL